MNRLIWFILLKQENLKSRRNSRNNKLRKLILANLSAITKTVTNKQIKKNKNFNVMTTNKI